MSNLVKHATSRPNGMGLVSWRQYLFDVDWGDLRPLGVDKDVDLSQYVRVDVYYHNFFDPSKDQSTYRCACSLWMDARVEDPAEQAFIFTNLGYDLTQTFSLDRSMSVGDYAVVRSTPSRSPMAFRCDSSGWSSVHVKEVFEYEI